MNRPLACATVIVLLLGAAACTTGKDKETEGGATPTTAADNDSTCKQLLGEPGLKWLEDRTGGKARLEVVDDLERARSLFHRQVKDWTPEETGVPTFLRARPCLATTDAADTEKQLEIRYGPSYFPFDTSFDEATGVSPAQTETPVNPAVKLVHGKDSDGIVRYRVYVKCKIPGTPAEQENEIPIEGRLTDSLTGETSTRVHLTHLLHSAKVVADSFGCENKPAVPAEPPASVN
ncbi:hypothetical protein OHA27_13800 [Streptomyces sp. NBC_01619]|uniref:Uncharacterized protein n=1 Tax=Streptomyces pratisoli TaxID=3139917 RepID=A0ACC6QH16_9ACTN|nr:MULTISPECIES: hypothetical protein [unclassified Streptomyces]MCX4511361.1 hypothetical protein [Streptomyces sp. NBC_01619]